jgi:hypothetical protein
MKNTLNRTIKTSIVIATLGCVALTNTKQAYAQTTALTNIVGANAVAGGDFVLGWEFTTNSTVSVTHLGVFDAGSNGLLSSHDVGLYRVSDGALLASTTIATTDTLDTGYRYKSIPTTILNSGQAYRVAAVFPELGLDPWTSSSTSYSLDSNLNFVGPRAAFSSTLTNPTVGGSGNGYFSANLKIAAPEPGTLALITMGGVGFASRLRRRKLA